MAIFKKARIYSASHLNNLATCWQPWLVMAMVPRRIMRRL